MSAVWDRSQHSGTNLLMLLAVSDFCDDEGVCYPAVPKLAKKCRMSKRNAQDRLRELSESGELTILKNQGPPPKFPNLFQVNLDALGVKPTAPVKYNVERGEAHCTPGVKPTAPKPSVNHQEPSTSTKAAKSNRSQMVDDGFEAFWKGYPKKVAKLAALKEWKKLKPTGQIFADLMAALAVQKNSTDWTKQGGRYAPYPATWLNGRRWEDESGHADAQVSAVPVNPVFAGAI